MSASCGDSGIEERVGHDDFNFDLGKEIDGVLAAAVNLGMAFLTAKAFHFGDGHAFDAEVVQGILHLIELEGFNDGLNFFHPRVADTNNGEKCVNRILPGVRNFFQKKPSTR